MCAWFGVFFKRRNRIFCACRHLGGGALLRNLSDKNAFSSASLSGQNATENLTPQEQLLAGTLELDPENDPVIATTDWGLDIKFHSVGEGIWQPSLNTSTLSSGYCYFTTDIYNWIIIGYSTKTASAGPVSGINVKVNPDSTDAGNEIKNYASRGQIMIKSYTVSAYANALGTPDIPAGCVLCLSAKTTGKSEFNKISGVSSYPDSTLNSAITSVYNKIKYILNDQIQLTPLTTYGYNGSSVTTYSHSEYLFPLAYKGQNASQSFCVETYLDTETKRDFNDYWWLRTGSSTSSLAHGVTDDGKITYLHSPWSTYSSNGVRPAFVLKL